MRDMKIGTAEDWEKDYKENIDSNVNNSINPLDKAVCFWFDDGSDCYDAKGTIDEIKKVHKISEKSLMEVVLSFGLSDEQYNKLKNAVN